MTDYKLLDYCCFYCGLETRVRVTLPVFLCSDGRHEVFHMQRELLKERTRCRALEDELGNPLNVHRWRKLEVGACIGLLQKQLYKYGSLPK